MKEKTWLLKVSIFNCTARNDCYTYQDFDIPIGVGEDKPFRHLILTGRNGSGKTTILRGINDWMIRNRRRLFAEGTVRPIVEDNWAWSSKNLYTFFESRRQTNLGKVSTVTSEIEFISRSEEGLSNLLKQFSCQQEGKPSIFYY